MYFVQVKGRKEKGFCIRRNFALKIILHSIIFNISLLSVRLKNDFVFTSTVTIARRINVMKRNVYFIYSIHPFLLYVAVCFTVGFKPPPIPMRAECAFGTSRSLKIQQSWHNKTSGISSDKGTQNEL